MGLDMYLWKRHYISTWADKGVKALDLPSVPSIKAERIVRIDEQVMYWRKTNQVHAWFVANVQKGTDDCGEYEVNRDQLTDLVGLCEAVLADPDKAAELLPTESGFFFGSTDYGEWYFDDLKKTRDKLKEELSSQQDPDDICWFVYQASW